MGSTLPQRDLSLSPLAPRSPSQLLAILLLVLPLVLSFYLLSRNCRFYSIFVANCGSSSPRRLSTPNDPLARFGASLWWKRPTVRLARSDFLIRNFQQSLHFSGRSIHTLLLSWLYKLTTDLALSSSISYGICGFSRQLYLDCDYLGPGL